MRTKRIKIILYILIVVLIAPITNGCSKKIITIDNVSSSQIYLQSVNWKKVSNKYGYSFKKPIVLKLSKEYGHDNIIDEYIKRLGKSGEKQSYGMLHKFIVISKSKIPLNKRIKECDFENSIFKYEIATKDGNFKETLYFKLDKRNKEFYIPKGFLYATLVGC